MGKIVDLCENYRVRPIALRMDKSALVLVMLLYKITAVLHTSDIKRLFPSLSSDSAFLSHLRHFQPVIRRNSKKKRKESQWGSIIVNEICLAYSKVKS